MDLTSCLTTVTSFAAALLATQALCHARKVQNPATDNAKPDFPVFDRCDDAVLIVSPAGLIRYANVVAAELLEQDSSRLVGQRLDQILQNDHATPDQKNHPATAHLITSQNDEIEVAFTRVPLWTGDYLWIFRDVRSRRAETLMARDERDVLENIASGRPLDSVIDGMAAAALHQKDGPRLAVLVRRDGAAQCFGAVPPETRRAMERVDCAWGDVSNSWWTLPRIFDDVQSDPIFAAAADGLQLGGVRACWSFPIKFESAGNDQTAGVLLAFPLQQVRPTAEDLCRIDRYSKLMSLAMERDRLAQCASVRSLSDPLTGLPNRMLTSDRLTHAINHARRGGTQLATVVIDLDGFKALNDSIGNQAGDALLQQVADRLKPCVRSSDTLGRLGNDQFIVVAGDVNPQTISLICERLIATFKEAFTMSTGSITLSASLGVAAFPQDGDDTNALLRNADTAMLHAKRQSRGTYRLYESFMSTASVERLELENQLRQAVDQREIVPHFQPLCTVDGRVVAVEALARWKRNGVMITPAKFIPVAEETGLIVHIGQQILRQACEWCKKWQLSGRSPLRVAVNVSALQFAQNDFVEMVRQTLADADLDPVWLEVEVTESLLMQNTKNVANKLEQLRAMGVAVAIDDFGTGYSSLAYLQKLPIDILKIDRSFVKEIDAPSTGGADRTAVIRAILSMAHSLKLKVVAEGVETVAQWEFLQRAGCHLVQGYHFCPPKPPGELAVAVDRLNGAAVTTQAA